MAVSRFTFYFLICTSDVGFGVYEISSLGAQHHNEGALPPPPRNLVYHILDKIGIISYHKRQKESTVQAD